MVVLVVSKSFGVWRGKRERDPECQWNRRSVIALGLAQAPPCALPRSSTPAYPNNGHLPRRRHRQANLAFIDSTIPPFLLPRRNAILAPAEPLRHCDTTARSTKNTTDGPTPTHRQRPSRASICQRDSIPSNPWPAPLRRV